MLAGNDAACGLVIRAITSKSASRWTIRAPWRMAPYEAVVDASNRFAGAPGGAIRPAATRKSSRHQRSTTVKPFHEPLWRRVGVVERATQDFHRNGLTHSDSRCNWRTAAGVLRQRRLIRWHGSAPPRPMCRGDHRDRSGRSFRKSSGRFPADIASPSRNSRLNGDPTNAGGGSRRPL